MFSLKNHIEKTELEKAFENVGLVYKEHDIQREKNLETYLKFYLGLNYSDRVFNWDQNRVFRDWDEEEINRSGADWNTIVNNSEYFKKPLQKIPFDNRKPLIKSNLPQSIVEKVTSLLLGQNNKPIIKCENEQTQDFINSFLKETSFFERLIVARNYCGAMGSILVGWSIIENKLNFNIIDARYVTPIYQGNGLKQIIVKYSDRLLYVIDNNFEYIFRALVEDDKPVLSDTRWQVENNLHGFEKIPYYFIPNSEILNDYDGLSDYHNQLENFNAIDRISSELIIGVENNVDPSMVFSARDPQTAKRSSLQTGSDTVIYCATDEDVKYIEINGNGIAQGRELIKDIEDQILRSCRVTLDQAKATGTTATEINAIQERAFEKINQLRIVYGNAIENLIKIALKYLNIEDDIEVEWPKGSKTIQEKALISTTLKTLADSIKIMKESGIEVDQEMIQNSINKLIGELI
jgi:hypothetical protein